MSPGRQPYPLWEITKQKSWGVSWNCHTSLNKRKPAWRLHPLDACIWFCSFSVAAGSGFNQVTMPSVFWTVGSFFPAASSVFVSKSALCFPSLGPLSFWSWLLSNSCKPHSSEVLCWHKFTPDWSCWLFIDPYEFGGAASKAGYGKIQN